ncbi:MAG: ABC transporter ATP-binding protein [Clostridium sp.]|nr:ABC transporter ATP-binding protein [Clostridium sp.]
MEDKILIAKNLKKYYGEGDGLVKAVDNVSLKVNKGEFLTIVGASGSGKTTLLNCLCGIDEVDEGSININGTIINDLNSEERTIFRRRNIGIVFQQYNLIPVLNVYENIILPLEIDNKKVDKEYLDKVINILGIENKLYSSPNNLSGGQKQRVAIARALVSKAAIICADEPTGNLDSKNTIEVVNLLKKSAKEFSQTIIMITHNKEISTLSDRVIYIKDGTIEKEILNNDSK